MIKNRLKTVIRAALITALLPAAVFAAADIRSITIEPEYLCPGEDVTVTFEANHAYNRNLTFHMWSECTIIYS